MLSFCFLCCFRSAVSVVNNFSYFTNVVFIASYVSIILGLFLWRCVFLSLIYFMLFFQVSIDAVDDFCLSMLWVFFAYFFQSWMFLLMLLCLPLFIFFFVVGREVFWWSVISYVSLFFLCVCGGGLLHNLPLLIYGLVYSVLLVYLVFNFLCHRWLLATIEIRWYEKAFVGLCNRLRKKES